MGVVEETRVHGGWATLIKRGSRELLFSGKDAQTTNNRMEITAVISALEMIQENEIAVLYSDSKYVISGINEWIEKWIKNNWKTAEGWVKNQDLWERLYTLKSKRKVTFAWQRGHSTKQIELVDKLAKEQSASVE